MSAITYTTWPNKTTTQGTVETTEWPALIAALRSPPVRATKGACKMIKLATFERISRAQGSQVHEIHGIEGDYDKGEISLDEAASRLKTAGVCAFLYTSASHTPEKPRWRVLAPLSEVHTTATHSKVMALLNGALGGILAPESFDVRRCYFYGAVRGAPYETRTIAGACIDTLNLIIPVGIPAATTISASSSTNDDLSRLVTLNAVTADTMRDLRAALAAIPADGGYTGWFDKVQALASLKDTAFADEAYELADEWSQRFGIDYDEDELTRKWQGAIPESRTYRSIFKWASDAGWANPGAEKEAAPAEPPDPARFRRQSMIDFINRKRPVWRVKGLLPSTGVAMIYGASTSGKSFFSLDLAMAIARGEAWRGQATKQGPVTYVCAEGVDDFSLRVAAYAAHHNIQRTPFDVIDAAPNLMREDDVKALIAELMLSPVSVVFCDTMACMSAGGDENSAKDMNILLDHCKLTSRMVDVLIVLVHHTGKDESRGARGSSSIYAAMDTVIEISRAGDDRIAKISKQKGGADGQEFGFRLIPVPLGVDEDGDDIGHCVIEHIQVVPKAARQTAIKGDYQIVVMKALQTAFDLTNEGVSANHLVEVVTNEFTHDPTCKRDPRRQNTLRAINALRTANRIGEVAGRLVPM